MWGLIQKRGIRDLEFDLALSHISGAKQPVPGPLLLVCFPAGSPTRSVIRASLVIQSKRRNTPCDMDIKPAVMLHRLKRSWAYGLNSPLLVTVTVA